MFGAIGRAVTAPVRLAKRGLVAAKDTAMKEIVLGLSRHLLTGLGGALVTAGYISAGEQELGVGALLTLVGIALSIYDKRSRATT